MRKVFSEMLVILGVTATVAGISWATRAEEAVGPAACDPAQLKEGYICFADASKLENVLWVDARTRDLWEKNGYPGSVLLTDHYSENWPDLLEAAFGPLASADAVVVYCATEGCGSSEPVAEKIQTLGVVPAENVFVLAGGWKALRASND